MKIIAKADVLSELYEKHKELLKYQLVKNISEELTKYDVLIDPLTTSNKNGYTSLEMHFFVLSYSDLDKLREFGDKYPEMEKIIQNIMIAKVK